MKIEPTPDINIHHLIIQKISNLDEFEFSIVEVVPNFNEKWNHKSWEYNFRHRSSPVILNLIFAIVPNRRFLLHCSLVKSEKEWFSFRDYLTFIKSEDLKNFIEPDDPADYVEAYLDILIHHLGTGLQNVVKGDIWIDVPFDWSITQGHK